MTAQPARLCIAGGGTGGHVMPALALSDAARARWPSLTVEFIGAERGLEARLLPARGEHALLLPVHGVQGAGIWRRLAMIAWALPRAVWHILRHWQGGRPRLLVGVGGYASVAGVLAALLCRIPVVLHEQNAMPGLVNRRLARFAHAVMLGFAEAASRLPAGARIAVTGNIVRSDIAGARWRPAAADEPPCLLVAGGSQGARILNETAPAAGRILIRRGRRFRVIHLAGAREGEAERAAMAWREAGIDADVRPFEEDMAAFYASGQLLLARAGAMTVAEIAAVGMPSILVPLPHAADDHQTHNARVLADRGAATWLPQHDLTPESLANAIEASLFDPARLARMHAQARSAAIPDAADRQLAVLAPILAGEAGGAT
ncbi:MAG: undecaprenyldiphospho-muramoylpentapeptide beta-N-acetylglucosaminyltransferase [Mariprofundaceae bacterium]